MGPLPKINSCFGPITPVVPTSFVQFNQAGLPAVYRADIMSSQRPNICWEILDQSGSPQNSKPSETAKFIG